MNNLESLIKNNNLTKSFGNEKNLGEYKLVKNNAEIYFNFENKLFIIFITIDDHNMYLPELEYPISKLDLFLDSILKNGGYVYANDDKPNFFMKLFGGIFYNKLFIPGFHTGSIPKNYLYKF